MGGGPCPNSFLCIWVQAEVMQLELGSSFKLVGKVLQVWARRKEDGAGRALYALALTWAWGSEACRSWEVWANGAVAWATAKE